VVVRTRKLLKAEFCSFDSPSWFDDAIDGGLAVGFSASIAITGKGKQVRNERYLDRCQRRERRNGMRSS
jgi:hypothetical protein